MVRAGVPRGHGAMSQSSGVDSPETVFAERFRSLNLATRTPGFEVRFRPYVSLRSTVRFDADRAVVTADLSDMLKGAPTDVLRSLATMLLCKLYRLRVPSGTSRPYKKWSNSPEVVDLMLRTKRQRGRIRLRPPVGRLHDLEALFDQLNDRYFDSALRKPTIGWSLHASRRKLGHYDPAHDAIAISQVFDRDDVPRIALEYVIYHEMLHIKHPAERCGDRRRVHTAAFHRSEQQFKGIAEAKRILQTF